MSKEIQCKCCKEYWWENNIHSKSGLCPNCYDYFANLQHQLKVADKALELACDKIADMLTQNGGGAWFYDFNGDTVIERNGFENFYKRYAKEMLKSD